MLKLKFTIDKFSCTMNKYHIEIPFSSYTLQLSNAPNARTGYYYTILLLLCSTKATNFTTDYFGVSHPLMKY